MSATLYLSREARLLGSDRHLRAQYARGQLVRLRHGVYVPSDVWQSLSDEDRYLARVEAAAAVSAPGTQACHDSAVALWRLPTWGPAPTLVHHLTEPSAGGTSRVGIRHHGIGLDPSPFEIDGVAVTSLARTLLDVASSSNFMKAIVTLDDALRPPEKGDFRHDLGAEAPTKREVLTLVTERMPFRGSAKAARALGFASGESGSPKESVFRVQCHALRLPPPELQVPFYDEEGLIGLADFYWRHLDLVVEVDGDVKYGAARKHQKHLSDQEILLKEKDREDRMRRVVKDFTRPPSRVIYNRRLLAPYLGRHGLVAASARV